MKTAMQEISERILAKARKKRLRGKSLKQMWLDQDASLRYMAEVAAHYLLLRLEAGEAPPPPGCIDPVRFEKAVRMAARRGALAEGKLSRTRIGVRRGTDTPA
jgi:hypothetical protein